MKIYNRQEFLKLPEGIIFSKGKPWYFDGLMVKGDSIRHITFSNLPGNGEFVDFYYRDLVWINSGKNDTEQFARLDGMLEEGKSYPLNTDIDRDGSYDNDEEIFLVYERDDLVSMLSVFSMALTVKLT